VDQKKKQYESAAGFFSKKKERKERAADTGMDFLIKLLTRTNYS